MLANEGPFVPLLIERQRGETQLFAKEVKVESKRYIVCRNETEAEKDRKDREAIVTALDAQLKRGDKALVRNSAYRRHLRKTTDGPAFAIDAGKLAEEARFDGVFVLRTNAKITPLQAVQISGFSQQQSSGGSLTFSSQYGLVDVASLPVLSVDGVPRHGPVPTPTPSPALQTVGAPSAGQAVVFATIEKLAELRDKGILSEEEFANGLRARRGRCSSIVIRLHANQYR